MNLGAVSASLPFEIIPGHEVDKATPSQIEEIKRSMAHAPYVTSFGPPWELDMGPVEHGEQIGDAPLPVSYRTFNQLPEAEWKYFVINCAHSEHSFDGLQLACDLSDTELEFGLWRTVIATGMTQISYHPARMFHVMEALEPGRLMCVSPADLARIAILHKGITSLDPSVLDLRNVLEDFSQLRSLDRRSHLRVLGYFAVLEMVLTHSPNPSDPYDSITRQVRTKMALLSNRFDTPFDVSQYFDGARPEKAWARLYGYRSAIAHGRRPTVEGEFSVLKSERHVLEFVKMAAKRVLTHALAEPALIRDLREC